MKIALIAVFVVVILNFLMILRETYLFQSFVQHTICQHIAFQEGGSATYRYLPEWMYDPSAALCRVPNTYHIWATRGEFYAHDMMNGREIDLAVLFWGEKGKLACIGKLCRDMKIKK